MATVRRRRLSGFTLIELLVVVSIIALLVSISMPSLNKAMAQARGVVCLTTLRELHTASVTYASMNNDRSVPLDFTMGTGKRHSWAEVLFQSSYSTQPDAKLDYPALTNDKGKYEYLTCKAASEKENSTGHYRVWRPGWGGGRIGMAPTNVPSMFDGVCDNPADVQAYGRTSPLVNPYKVSGSGAQPYDGRQADDAVIGIQERHFGGANYMFGDNSARRSTELRAELVEDFDLNGVKDTP